MAPGEKGLNGSKRTAEGEKLNLHTMKLEEKTKNFQRGEKITCEEQESCDRQGFSYRRQVQRKRRDLQEQEKELGVEFYVQPVVIQM